MANESINPFEPIVIISNKLDQVLSILSRINIPENHLQIVKEEEGFYDIGQASLFLHMPPSTIHFHKKNNSLPFIKSGKRLLFRRDALLKWLEDFNQDARAKISPTEKMIENRKRYKK